jgi:hypothetical protein
MTVCFIHTPVALAETATHRNFERAIEATDDTSIPVIYQGPPRARARVPESMSHLVPAVERLLECGATVDPDVVESVRQFLSRYGMAIDSPTINVMSDGGLQLVWLIGDAQVEVEFDLEGDRVVMVQQGDTVRADVFTDGQSALLSEALSVISRH